MSDRSCGLNDVAIHRLRLFFETEIESRSGPLIIVLDANDIVLAQVNCRSGPRSVPAESCPDFPTNNRTKSGHHKTDANDHPDRTSVTKKFCLNSPQLLTDIELRKLHCRILIFSDGLETTRETRTSRQLTGKLEMLVI
jgi:hypothetical protein